MLRSERQFIFKSTQTLINVVFQSHTLRNCVLSVITEVVSKVLTKHDLTDEEKEYRDEFIDILKEHIGDYSPLVRAKVTRYR